MKECIRSAESTVAGTCKDLIHVSHYWYPDFMLESGG